MFGVLLFLLVFEVSAILVEGDGCFGDLVFIYFCNCHAVARILRFWVHYYMHRCNVVSPGSIDSSITFTEHNCIF